MSTALCPACARSNVSHRVTCLYCGSPMPNPTPPPAMPVRKELSPELDNLIQEALRDGNASKLMAMLRRTPPSAPGAQSPPPVAQLENPGLPAQPPRSNPPRLVSRSPQSAPTAQAARSRPPELAEIMLGEEDALYTEEWTGDTHTPLEPPLLRLKQLVGQLLEAAMAGVYADALLALDALTPAAAEVRTWLEAQLPAPSTLLGKPAPTPGRLPALLTSNAASQAPITPPSNGYLLVLQSDGDPASLPVLARGLNLDEEKVRPLLRARYPQVVAEHSDRSTLSRQAEALLEARTVGCAVVSRAELDALSSPALVLGMKPGPPRRFRVTRAPLYALDVAADTWDDCTFAEAESVWLAVPGELVTPAPSQPTAGDASGLGGKRLGVVDLFGPGVGLRLVAGVTDFQGLPGQEASGPREALRQLLEALPGWWPGLHVEQRRVFLPDDVAGKNGRPTSVWDLWEEHSRLCRRFHRLAREEKARARAPDRTVG